MGQTLTKIAYRKGNGLILILFHTHNNFKAIKEYLLSNKEDFNSYNFTGGKAYSLYKEFSKDIKPKLINEFQANVRGIEYLYFIEKNKELMPSLVVNIGTGTSVTLKKAEFEHSGGSAMGGGFFMGLIKLLYNITDFQEALKLAKNGNRYNIDLKVSDIYADEDNRVDLIFREFTAASFGKIESMIDVNNTHKEDVINSLICLIGENIGSIACLMADNHSISDILFSGGFLKDNRVLKKILTMICRVNKKKAIFLKNSEYMGAIGVLFS